MSVFGDVEIHRDSEGRDEGPFRKHWEANITKPKEVPFKKEMLGVGHHRNKARIRTN